MKIKRINYLYWSSFILFIVSQFNGLKFMKGVLIINFVTYFIYCIITKKYTLKLYEMLFILLAILIIVVNFIYMGYFNYIIIYYLFVYLSIKATKISKIDLLHIINSTAIVYFIISIILNYTPIKLFMSYEVPLIVNKFSTIIYRFIGLEGSPAGPDIFYLIVLLVNTFYVEKKCLKNYLLILLSIIILFWTSSFSNIVALVSSIIILFIPRIFIFTSLFSINFHFIISYIFEHSNYNVRILLDKFSTRRAIIWDQVLTDYDVQFNIYEKLFGSNKLVLFEYFEGVIGNNPHNLYMYLIQKLGIVLYSLIFYWFFNKIVKLRDKYILFLVNIYLIYFVTNAGILSTWSSPINIFIFLYLIMIGCEKFETKK